MRDFQKQLSEALRQGGAPACATGRLLRELEDHAADLKAEGLELGLNETEALDFAERKLGEPRALAQRYLRMRRRRDWWGRHPRLLFGLAPLVVFILCFAGASLFLALYGNWQGWWSSPSSLSSETWMRLNLFVPLFYFAVLLVISILACRVADGYCYGWKWAVAACLVLSLHAYCHFVIIDFPYATDGGRFVWGYGFSMNVTSHLWKALAPLLVFAMYYLRTLSWRGHPYETST